MILVVARGRERALWVKGGGQMLIAKNGGGGIYADAALGDAGKASR